MKIYYIFYNKITIYLLKWNMREPERFGGFNR